ncbi:(2Fe-2S)-binding protein [Saprospiraceae bacterium]|nr:(2Fe-2S)-binding protein [Saprospiraceae bacterium]
MAEFTLDVNGEKKTVLVDQDTPLLWVLRDHLHLVGTKFGCGIAQCGACTVHMDGAAMRSCILPIGKVGNSKIVTIEGLSDKGDHPLQKAWVEHDVPQCGYCQSGQIMTAASFLKDNPKATEKEIEVAMAGNICRCSAYLKIKAAVKSVSKA